jgi:daunorubicin resistance ABC transporter ATP-binding subunit
MSLSNQQEAPVVEARNLHKTYGDVVAVDDLNLCVSPGEVVGLLGPNGAGKTTTIKMLTTLTSIEGGSASIGSFDVATEGDRVRQSIGLAGQSAAVDDKLTTRENLELFARLYHLSKKERKTRVEELIERFRLTEFADQPAGTLSGGQHRRLDIVAALIANPAAIFLDEPTTGLDPRSRGEIWEEIRLLASGGTAVVLTTQYLDEADQLADRIILIDKGRVVAEGSQAQLKSRLGRDVLEVRVSDESQAERLVAALTSAGGHIIEGTTIHIPVSSAAQSMAILDSIRDAGIELKDFSLTKPTLDDVFMAFTDAS